MTDSVFRDLKKLQFMDNSTEKDPLNPNISSNSDPPPIDTHMGSNTLDVPFTPQQRSFLLSILGLRDSHVTMGKPSTPCEAVTPASIQT